MAKMPPMRSPIQRQQLQKQPVRDSIIGVLEIQKVLAELQSFKANFAQILDSKVSEAEDALAKALQIQKGDRGIQGIPGLTIKGPKGDRGEKGDKGDKGEPGVILELDYGKVAEMAAALVPKAKDGESGTSVSLDDVLEALKKSKKLKAEDIDGLEQTASAVYNQLHARGGYLHGSGVPSLTAGTNIILTPKQDGGYIVSAQGGTGGANVTTQVVTAVQVGSDVTIALSQLTHFATYQAPVILVMRNQIPQTLGVTYTETATVVTVPNADAGEIYAITYAYSS